MEYGELLRAGTSDMGTAKSLVSGFFGTTTSRFVLAYSFSSCQMVLAPKLSLKSSPYISVVRLQEIKRKSKGLRQRRKAVLDRPSELDGTVLTVRVLLLTPLRSVALI